jgi:stage V sporulation protein SpoVS
MLGSAVGTVSLLAAADPGAAPSSPAPGLRGSCRLSLEASSPRITAGETVTLFGQLVCTNGMSAAGEPVTVYQRPSAVGASGLSEVGTATTEADGSYQFTPTAFNTNSVFVVRFPTAHNASTAVKVAPLVTISGPAANAQVVTGGHNRFTFTGTVSLAAAGAQVALQSEYAATGEQWRTIATGSVGPEGRYSIAHSFGSPGEVSVRVVVNPEGPNVAAASKSLSYVVSQAQNPQLTIQASADPISSGQSVTITGVAAGAANQAVMLLAFTRGHAFVAVAKDTTDGSGAYTFTVSPPQSTFYRVISNTTASTILFEGAKYLLTAEVSPTTVHAGKQLTFSGTLAPAHVGQAVYLERENASGIGFNIVDVGTVDAASAYSIVHTFNSVATCVMRIKVPTSSESQGSTSEPFTILVTPLPAPSRSEEPAGPTSPEGQT